MQALIAHSRLYMVSVLGILSCWSVLQADEPKGPLSGFAVARKWSDKSGKFKVQAKLKFANRDEVQLQKDDDKVVTVPFAKLSEPDQAFVDSFLSRVGRHLMVGAVAYDVEKGVPMWTYQSNPTARTTLGSYLITAFGDEKESTATIFRIPHEEAIRASADVDPAKIFAIVPGDSISVQYELKGVSPEQRQSIQQSTESKIQELGWRLSPNSPNKMLITVEQGKPEEADYYTHSGFGPGPMFSPFGGPPPNAGPPIKVQFVPWNHSLAISVNGETLFNAAYQRGAVSIPPHLMKAEYRNGLGQSTIDARGMH
jgi:hypothetical protein